MKITRWATYNIPLNFTSWGVAVDITWSTVYFTVKKESDKLETDVDAIMKKIITSHTDPTNGKTLLILSANDTNIDPGDYIHDCVIKSSTGSILKTNTCVFTVEKPVTEVV